MYAPKKENVAPYTITDAAGTTYTHIPETETFSAPNLKEPVTALYVMKAVFPATKSMRSRITPPADFFKFGPSTRFKIIKMFQLYSAPPPITPETNKFIDFFHTLSEKVEGHWTVQQQWGAAKWAAGNEEMAAALLLYYGWSTRYPENIPGQSMYSIIKTKDGLIIDIAYDHLFQERFDKACAEIRNAYVTYQIGKYKDNLLTALNSVGLKEFYFYKNRYISIYAEYANEIKSKLIKFIEELVNPINKGKHIPTPDIDEPEDILEDEIIALKWKDFKVEPKVSTSQREHLLSLGAQKTLEALQERLAGFDHDETYKRCDLPLHNRLIASAKKQSFLLSPKHGYYTLNFPEKEES